MSDDIIFHTDGPWGEDYVLTFVMTQDDWHFTDVLFQEYNSELVGDPLVYEVMHTFYLSEELDLSYVASLYDNFRSMFPKAQVFDRMMKYEGS